MTRFLDWFKTSNRAANALYFALVLDIMLPLLRPGYLLALDLSWTPNIPVPAVANNYFLFFLTLHWLNFILPSQLIEKCLLFAILWLAASGAHRLVKAWGGLEEWPCYFAGVLYLFSPFAYSRFLAGQYLILLAYALMPWFLSSLWTFIRSPGLETSARMLSWTIIVSIVDLHSIFFMVLLSSISIIGMSLSDSEFSWPAVAKWGLRVSLAWSALSSYWLVPLLLGTSSTASLIRNFNGQFVQAFKTVGDPKFGLLFNVAGGYGFWVDKVGRYILPKNLVPLWPELAILFVTLSIIGLVAARHQIFPWIVSVFGAISFVLGVGVAYPPFAGIYNFLFDHVPFFKGEREPEKFIGLLVLSYSFLGAIGASSIATFARQRTTKLRGELLGGVILPLLLIVAPIIYNPVEMWGFAGQMKPTNYPSDWYAVNKQLDRDKSNFEVLFLPWHMYLSFSFTQGVIYNPASSFFDKPTIQGDNIQIGKIYTGVTSSTSAYVEKQILKTGPSVSNIGQKLNHLNIKYVILAKNPDASNYEWLGRQLDLKRINDTKDLMVYRNTAWQENH